MAQSHKKATKVHIGKPVAIVVITVVKLVVNIVSTTASVK